MAVFIVIPILIVIFYAMTDNNGHITLKNFIDFFSNKESLTAFVYSLYIAFLTTAICLVLAYPVAYFLSNEKYNKSQIMIVLFILPMWMNFMLRTLAIREIFYMLDMRFGELTTLIGMVYNFLPFMILPIYTNLLKIDKSLIEAASDLGATPFTVVRKVVFPLSMPGVLSGVLMVFMPTISTFVISDFLSLARIQLLGNLINLSFGSGGNWHYGSAISLILLILIGITFIFQKNTDENSGGGLW